MQGDAMKKAQDACVRAANRLHHLSMRYVGALHEAATGKRCGLLPMTHPGLKETRDFLDLILLTRAEINGLTNLLVGKGVFTALELAQESARQYDWLTNVKAEQLGVTVTDVGLSYHVRRSDGVYSGTPPPGPEKT